ncbi:hypothetical protein Hanom_Chr01g00025371 [Helianthus anomalus]
MKLTFQKKIRVNFKDCPLSLYLFSGVVLYVQIDDFCPLCFHIIHVLSFRPNPVSFFS